MHTVYCQINFIYIRIEEFFTISSGLFSEQTAVFISVICPFTFLCSDRASSKSRKLIIFLWYSYYNIYFIFVVYIAHRLLMTWQLLISITCFASYSKPLVPNEIIWAITVSNVPNSDPNFFTILYKALANFPVALAPPTNAFLVSIVMVVIISATDIAIADNTARFSFVHSLNLCNRNVFLLLFSYFFFLFV